MFHGSNVKILVTLADRGGCVRPEEFVAEDLCQEYVVGLVLRFEAVAAHGGVGASQVSWFPGFVQGAEGGRNVLGAGVQNDVEIQIANPIVKAFWVRVALVRDLSPQRT
jgi:hypothetical protein